MTENHGNSAGSWNTTPRRGDGSTISSPSTRTMPRVGRSNPATMLSRVDLPHPEGPRIATNSRSATLRLMSSSASTRRSPLANSFQTPSISIMHAPRACASAAQGARSKR